MLEEKEQLRVELPATRAVGEASEDATIPEEGVESTPLSNSTATV